MHLTQELNAHRKELKEVTKKAQRNSQLMIGALSTFFTLQFGLGYYTIFEVSWLGWDLVEPVTYTIGQGSFVLGLVYMYRNRKRGVEYSEMENFLRTNRVKKWYYDNNRQ